MQYGPFAVTMFQWFRSVRTAVRLTAFDPSKLPASCLRHAHGHTNRLELKPMQYRDLCAAQVSGDETVLPASFWDFGWSSGQRPFVLERMNLQLHCIGENALLSRELWSSGCEMSVGSVLKKRRSKMNKHKYKKKARNNRFKTKQ